MNPKVIKIKTLEEFLKVAGALPKKAWVFRGHSDKTWKIESTLARYCRNHDKNISKKWLRGRELESIRKFQKAGHQFLVHLPADDDLLSWLAVMRHYGAPTRLIDFTYSPVTALFFAVSSPERDFSPFTVHAIHTQSVMQGACQKLGKSSTYRLSVDDFKLGNEQSANFAGLFEGRWDSPRQVVQQGLFMITSRHDTDVAAFLQTCPKIATGKHEQPWLRFEFPRGREFHKKAINYLLTANQTHATLYPGIEGLAQSLFMKFYEPLPLTEKYWDTRSKPSETAESESEKPKA